MSGKFIVLEGMDGAGKTTQSELLYKYLTQVMQLDTTLTVEPTKTSYGNKIRNIINATNVSNDTIIDMFALDRYEHVFGDNGIKSMLDNDEIVICDRYYHSSMVYQSNKDLVIEKNNDVIKFRQPDLIIFLLTTPSTAICRVDGRNIESGNNNDSYETVSRAYEIRDSYLGIINDLYESNQNFIVIDDDTLSIEEVSDMILDEVQKIIE